MVVDNGGMVAGWGECYVRLTEELGYSPRLGRVFCVTDLTECVVTSVVFPRQYPLMFVGATDGES